MDVPTAEIDASIDFFIMLMLMPMPMQLRTPPCVAGELLADGPYVDCFRQLWPDATGALPPGKT